MRQRPWMAFHLSRPKRAKEVRFRRMRRAISHFMGLSQFVAVGHFSFRADEDDAVFAVGAQHQHFGHEVRNLPWREVHHRQHLAPDEVFFGVEFGNLGGRFFLSQFRPEVDEKLVGRFPCFLEVPGFPYGAHANVQFHKIIKYCHHFLPYLVSSLPQVFRY